MDGSANKDGRMTIDRVEAIRAFIRQSGSPADGQIGESNTPRLSVTKERAKELGEELISEAWKNKGANTTMDIDKAKKLIAEGADVSLKGGVGNFTALMLASANGYAELVGLLISSGADLNAKNLYGRTALMRAAAHGNGEIAEMLIRNGANMNERDNYGDTALMTASDFGYTDFVKILLRKGADVQLKNNIGKTAMDLATREEIKELLKDAMGK